ncbi:hypothetical protein T439DRAFT_377147 [Meredithblackwellia eburnea MCA 4105]
MSGYTNLATEQSHMDRLTQTQDAIDELVKIMYSSLSYLTRKAQFKQVNQDIPITQTIPNSEPEDVFKENQKELVGDFLRKAKQLEYLIASLPTPQEDDTEADLEELQKESEEVNREYEEALLVAEELHLQLKESLKAALDARAAQKPVA